MEKYFELLLDLLFLNDKIEYKNRVADYKKLAEFIVKNKDKNFNFYHKFNFIFENFLRFTKEEIELEKFMQLGDIQSDEKLKNKRIKNSLDFFSNKEYLKINKKAVIVLDKKAKFLISKEQINEFNKIIREKELIVFYI